MVFARGCFLADRLVGFLSSASRSSAARSLASALASIFRTSDDFALAALNCLRAPRAACRASLRWRLAARHWSRDAFNASFAFASSMRASSTSPASCIGEFLLFFFFITPLLSPVVLFRFVHRQNCACRAHTNHAARPEVNSVEPKPTRNNGSSAAQGHQNNIHGSAVTIQK